MNKPTQKHFKKSMSRPTTKDLAKAAGVSRATVDRVLNEREGVRKSTVDRVNAAIQELGFVRNIQAANLARSQTYRFVFALPGSGDQFLDEIMRQIYEAEKTFVADLIQCDVVQINENDPHSISEFLDTLQPKTTNGVAIMAPESPQTRDAIIRLQDRGVAALPFISNQAASAEHLVGIDNRAAGATAANLIGRFCRTEKGSVMVVAESMQSRDSLERRLGFDAELNSRFANLSALPSLETYGDRERAETIISTVVRNNPDLLAIYVVSSEARIPLTIIEELEGADGLIKVAHERTLFTSKALIDGQLDAVIAQNPGHLVRSAIRKLKSGVDRVATHSSQDDVRVEILLRTNI